MANKPYLLIRPVEQGGRGRPPGGGGRSRRLDPSQQAPRILPRFQELEEYLERRRAAPLRATPSGAAPEEVLVFEVSGSVDEFVRAVRNTDGMEWLVESDEFLFPHDDEFGSRDSTDEPYGGRLYFVMANQEAIRQLRAMWATWVETTANGGAWPTGLTPWRDVFAQLRDVRPWGASDRLLETGFAEVIAEEQALGGSEHAVEVELWYRGDASLRSDAEATVAEAVRGAGGVVGQTYQLADIQYHGMLVRLPSRAVDAILSGEPEGLHQYSEVMFLKPTGQFAGGPLGNPEPTSAVESLPDPPSQGAPRVAVLDGLPLANHVLLADRLLIDDPNDWAPDYPAASRRHGTAMASLVLHGDLDGESSSLTRRIYVSPVLRPNPFARDLNSDTEIETFPPEELAVETLHRAIQRMVSSEQGGGSTVRIVNLSIGNPYQLFDHAISPMARLLDWLAHKHNLLFVVAAGNHNGEIEVGLDEAALAQADDREVDSRVANHLWSTARNRRLLSPAESVNALTVGAAHADSSEATLPREIRVFAAGEHPSPVSALGFGFKKSVKPDLLAPGGRVPFRLGLPPSTALEQVQTQRAPGLRHAFPGFEGDLTATAYTRGTSNAAALTSNLAGRVYEVLERSGIQDDYRTVITKALLVHGCHWPAEADEMAAHLGLLDPDSRSRQLSRFFGYGLLSPNRVLTAADERATLVGWGMLEAELAEMYEIPLPQSLSGLHDWRRLTVTLAWLTPVNHAHQKYRRAQLWFDMIDRCHEVIQTRRSNAQWQSVRRGTLQHEVFEGARAAVFAEDRRLRIRVNSRGDAGGYEGAVPYGLAVTLEVAPQLQLPIYDEIEARIPVGVRVGV